MASYREPDPPKEDPLPDIVGKSARSAAIKLALSGLVCFAGATLFLMTSVLRSVTIASVMAISIGVGLEIAALVFWIRTTLDARNKVVSDTEAPVRVRVATEDEPEAEVEEAGGAREKRRRRA